MNIDIMEVERSLESISDMLLNCLQRAYRGYHPDTTFNIFVSYPKAINSTNKVQSDIRVNVSSDLAGEIDLSEKIIQTRQQVIDCVNDELKSHNKEDGLIYTFVHNPSSETQPPKLFDLDKTDFLYHVEASLEKNLYAKIYNIKHAIQKRRPIEKIIYINTMLDLITDKDIRDLILYLFRQYEQSQLNEFLIEYLPYIIEVVKDMIDKL